MNFVSLKRFKSKINFSQRNVLVSLDNDKPEFQPALSDICESCGTEVDIKAFNEGMKNFNNHAYCSMCQP